MDKEKYNRAIYLRHTLDTDLTGAGMIMTTSSEILGDCLKSLAMNDKNFREEYFHLLRKTRDRLQKEFDEL